MAFAADISSQAKNRRATTTSTVKIATIIISPIKSSGRFDGYPKTPPAKLRPAGKLDGREEKRYEGFVERPSPEAALPIRRRLTVMAITTTARTRRQKSESASGNSSNCLIVSV